MSKILPFSQVGHPDISQLGDSLISVPYTTITNRAQIRDISKGMAPSMGIQRIPVQSIYQLQTEFGASGEPVWASLNDDQGLIRFVGSWTPTVDSRGQYIASGSNTSDYVEVTFFGTGLNVLVNNRTAQTVVASVDGAAEGSSFMPSSPSSVIDARNYSANIVVSVVSGLTIGIHTIKMRNNNGSAPWHVYGFEVLNESSTVRINSGKIIKDQRQVSLDTAQSLAYKPSSLTGSKGGRVVTYNQGGVIGQAVQAVDSTALYLTNANHSNEEIVRTYSWREFGAGRSDDFSYYSSSLNGNLAFSLDDGTTTLVGNQVRGDNDLHIPGSANSFVTLTFVGTGLDLTLKPGNTGTNTSTIYQVYVDGASVGYLFNVASNTAAFTQKVCSGLPYGTHTVKILCNGATVWDLCIKNFIVYQPKKPSLPAGAVELADYNVIADYVANSTATIDAIATSGILRKGFSREAIYTGTWTIAGIDPPNVSQGVSIRCNTANSTLKYTFFGTGFEFRFGVAGATQFTMSIDGSSNFTTSNGSYWSGALTTSFYGASATFTTSTGVWAGTVANNGNGINIRGLNLGMHTITVTYNSGVIMVPDALDIITPIHSVKSNLLADLQNTLPVGSCSLQDSRQLVASNKTQNKAWAQAVGVVSGPSTGSTTAVPCPDMSCTIKVSNSGRIKATYSISNYNSSTFLNYFQVYVNGIAVGAIHVFYSTNAQTTSDTVIVPVSAGIHKVDVYWYTQGGTATAHTTYRSLVVEEL